MSIKLADLFLALGADLSGLDRDLGRAETQTRSWVSNLGGTVTTLLGGVVVAGATAAVGAVVGIGTAAFHTANEVDEAQARLRTTLGLTADEAEAMGDVVQRVYANNWGESIDDVADSLATVQQGMHALYRASDEELGSITEYALALRDAFDVDVSESVQAANQIVEQFGVSSDEAFTIIAAGMQYGVNSTDDLLDTLNEYAADFADLGLTADDTLSLLNAGLGAGVYNTDKIGDLMREFKINLLDVGRLETIEGLNSDVDDLIGQFQRGEIAGIDAFEGITTALQHMEDPIAQNEIGVALMGSLWEDLGAEAVFRIDTMSDSLTNNYDVLGSLGEQSMTIGQRMQGIWRRVQMAFEPIGELIVNLVEQALPYLEAGAQQLADNMPAIIAWITEAFGNIGTFITEELVPQLQTFAAWFSESAWPVIQEVAAWIVAAFGNIGTFVTEEVVPRLQEFAAWFSESAWPVIQEVAAWIVAAFENIAAFVVNEVVPRLQVFAAWFSENAWPVIQEVAAWIVTAFGNIAAFVVDEVIPRLQQLVSWFMTNAWPTIEIVIGWLIDAFGQLRTFIEDTLAPAVETTFNSVRTWIEAAWSWFETNILPSLTSVFDVVASVFAAFRSAFQGDWEGFGSFLRDAWDTIWTGIGDIVSNIGTTIGNVIQDIINAFLNTDWLAVGQSIINGIGQGISNFAGGLAQSAQNAANNAIGAVRGFLGIQSPSRVMAEQVGQPMAEGIAMGIDDAATSISRAMSGAIQMPSLPSLPTLQMAGAAVGASGGGGTRVQGGLHFHFDGAAPQSQDEADTAVRYLVESLRKKGINL